MIKYFFEMLCCLPYYFWFAVRKQRNKNARLLPNISVLNYGFYNNFFTKKEVFINKKICISC